MNWRSRILGEFADVRHGSTGRDYGRLRFGSAPRSEIVANRTRLAVENGFHLESVVLGEQVHGAGVAVVAAAQAGAGTLGVESYLKGIDSMVTQSDEVVLVVRTADCVPILMFDPVSRTIAAIHAGWRGTAERVVARTLSEMRGTFGVRPSDLRVAIGPCICGSHYDVSLATDGRDALFESLFRQPGVVLRQGGRVSIDLVEANRRECLLAGIAPACIEASGICTFEDPIAWASHRAGDIGCDYQVWSYIYLG